VKSPQSLLFTDRVDLLRHCALLQFQPSRVYYCAPQSQLGWLNLPQSPILPPPTSLEVESWP